MATKKIRSMAWVKYDAWYNGIKRLADHHGCKFWISRTTGRVFFTRGGKSISFLTAEWVDEKGGTFYDNSDNPMTTPYKKKKQ